MSTEGPNSPATGANDNSYGTEAWVGPTSIDAADGTTALAGSAATVTTNYLTATDFGFSAIPDSATITNIAIDIKQAAEGLSGASVVDDRLRLIIGGAIQATDFGSGTPWSSGATAYVTRNATTNLPTAAQVKASTFGVALAVAITDPGSEGEVAYVDHIRLTITYTAAATSSARKLNLILI